MVSFRGDALVRALSWPNLKRLGLIFALLVLASLLLLDLESSRQAPVVQAQVFEWKQDRYWAKLEAQFLADRKLGCGGAGVKQQVGIDALNAELRRLEGVSVSSSSAALDRLQFSFFDLAAHVAACPKRVRPFLESYRRLRNLIKSQSVSWSMSDRVSRTRLYTALYGGRAAVEEVLLQLPQTSTQSVLLGETVKAKTPSTMVYGVRIHSGDILVSRGGAPTSALIARGNDHPGNFSHIALVHIEAQSQKISIIESHIEVGVVVSDLETYLADKKLRIMVLRLRENHPALKAKPDLAHRAAQEMLAVLDRRHLPYDFAMDYRDHEKQFCSEVASSAYESQGVTLWSGLTRTSGRGARNWLYRLGVRHFETHGPSDLEYDPQVAVVAEFRDLETLFDDHLDNAILDAMLEGADRGEGLTFDRSRLPLARIAKAYSYLLNRFGKAGPIPEGMSATTGLRVQRMSQRHQAARVKIKKATEGFRSKNGYRPPYWQLLKMARTALAADGSDGQ